MRQRYRLLLLNQGIRAACQPEGQLLRRLGGDAGQMAGKKAVQGAGKGCQPGHQLRLVQVIGVQLVLGRGHHKGQAGQHLAHPAHVQAHMAQGVQNAPLLRQRQVAVLAHGFKIQHLFPAAFQLVPAQHPDFNQPVAPQLADSCDAPACQMLSHQHAEHGRFLGVFIAGPRQMHPGAAGGGRNQQAQGFPGAPQGEDDHIMIRLGHLIHPGAQQFIFQFPGQKAQGQSVKGHTNLRKSLGSIVS